MIVQSQGAAFPQGVGNTATPVLNGVTAGNAILVGTIGQATAPATPVTTVNDGAAYVDLAGSPAGLNVNYYFVNFALLQNVAAGTHAIVTKVANATQMRGFAVAIEIAGFGPLDVLATTTNTGATGTTAPVANASELALSIIAYKSSVLFATTLPPGYTNIYNQPDGNIAGVKGSIDFKSPLAAGGQMAAYQGGAITGGSIILVLKATGISVVRTTSLASLGVGA